jgi:succinyl-CoA synthetase beta subunit
VKGILFNINLQITPAEEAARGIVDIVGNDDSNLVIAGIIHGTESEKALAILKNTNIKLCRDAKEAIEFLKVTK